MDFEPTPRHLEGMNASNRIARREALFRMIEGGGKSRVIFSGVLALAVAIYVGWAWSPWQSLIVWFLLSLIWELHIQTSRRFGAVAELLREEALDRTQYRR